MSGFQTSARPRPILNQRPAMPVVPFSRVGRPEPVTPAKPEQPPAEVIRQAFRLVCSQQEAAPKEQEITVEPRPRPTLRMIAEHVAMDFGVSVHELKSERRTLVLVRPRQAMFWLACELTGHSLPAIGRAYGGKDHTTVLHGKHKCAAGMQMNDDYRATVMAIRERLEPTA